MSSKAKREYFNEIRERYIKSSKEDKKKILDEYCQVCGYNRKYAIRKLRGSTKSVNSTKERKKKRGRPKIYWTTGIQEFLSKTWAYTNLICSKRLKAVIPLWLPYYKAVGHELTEEDKKLLKKISPSTIDRILKKYRKRYGKRGYSTTKPGSLLKELVPIKTEQWDERRPGFVEADTVAHCGNSVSGTFIYTVNLTDLSSGWMSLRAVWGKGEYHVFNAIKSIEVEIPFKILGFDCDNGNEFLNYRLLKYFKNKSYPVSYTRSRPYKKNDNAHIEEKNWTVVRQYLGYKRFDNLKQVDMLNDLYSNELSLFINFFIPSVKLIEKYRIGSKIIKKHDKPKTPYQRLIGSKFVDKKTKIKLAKQFNKLNPFNLQKRIKIKISKVMELA